MNDKMSAEKSVLSLKSDLEGQLKTIEMLKAQLANLESVEKNAAEMKTKLDSSLNEMNVLKKENQKLSEDLASQTSLLVQAKDEFKGAQHQLEQSQDIIKGNCKILVYM